MNEFSRLSFLSYECMACYCSPRPRIVRDYELDLYYGGRRYRRWMERIIRRDAARWCSAARGSCPTATEITIAA